MSDLDIEMRGEKAKLLAATFVLEDLSYCPASDKTAAANAEATRRLTEAIAELKGKVDALKGKVVRFNWQPANCPPGIFGWSCLTESPFVSRYTCYAPSDIISRVIA